MNEEFDRAVVMGLVNDAEYDTLRKLERTGEFRLVERLMQVKEQFNWLAFGYAQAKEAGAVSGQYRPENLMSSARDLLTLCGMLEYEEAYVSAVVDRYVALIEESKEA